MAFKDRLNPNLRDEDAPRTGPPVPNMGGNPAPRASQPRSFVAAPQSPRMAPPGPEPAPPAPAAPAAPGGAQPPDYLMRALRPQTHAPAPQPATTAPAAPVAPAPAPAGPAPTAPAPAAAPVQPAAAPAPATPAYALNRMPLEHEVATLPPGATLNTPMGDVVKGPDGKLDFVPNERGRAAQEQARREALRKFGPYPGASDKNAPPPPIVPGRYNYNPFTGTFTR